MSSAAAPAIVIPTSSPPTERRQKWERVILWIMEGLLLALLFFSPWSYGAVHPGYEFLLNSGIALLLLLWAARIVVSGQFHLHKCPLALCLTALFITAVWQLIPWPREALALLSPRTAQLYEFLLPTQHEILPMASGEATAAPQAGTTISFCPGVTQREALRYLTIVLVFVLVRNNLASSAHLRRLSLIVFINGILLSLFALMQFYTYGSHLVYGFAPTEGTAFGPFICRNHFPYYVNICLGLGMGLLLSSLVGQSKSRRHARGSSRSSKEEAQVDIPAFDSPSHREHGNIRYSRPKDTIWSHLLGSLTHLLNKPRALGLFFAVAILAAGVLFSASRGGGLAMLGGALLCLFFHLRNLAAAFKLGLAGLVLGLVMALFLAWFGLEQIQERWERLFVESDTTSVQRLEIWSANLPSVREFPLWGTGYGSFEFTELLHRDKAELEGTLWEHVHNDYLELLLEGGIAGLLPVLCFVGLLFWYGFRALRRQHESSAGWLATGAFFGLTTLVIHSFVDFGLHIPAIAFLATVLCAHLGAMGSRRSRSSRRSGTTEEPAAAENREGTPLAWGKVLPVGVALALGFFAVLLIQQSWKAHKAERYRDAAEQLVNGVENPDRPRQITYLRAAVREAPRLPYLRLDLARAQLSLYMEQIKEVKERALLNALACGVGNMNAVGPTDAGLSSAASVVTGMAVPERLIRRAGTVRAEPLLKPALASYLVARDLCPLMTEPHLRLAANVEKLERADKPETYLQRAEFLSPASPDVWYMSGRQELIAGRPDQAWPKWRHSLEKSNLYLTRIMDQARPLLSTQALLEKVLPEKPSILYEAAMYLRPEEDETADRRPYLMRASAILAEMNPPSPEDQYVQALVLDELGQKKEALAACNQAVLRAPAEVEWRVERAKLLYEDGQLKEAENQLRTVLTQKPSHEEARRLLEVVRKQIALEK